MKRYVCLLIVGLSLVLCLCGCQKEIVQIVDESSEPVKNTSSEIGGEETLTEKLIREIDDSYLEESKSPEYGTTAGMMELAERYTDKWKQVADDYYDKIMDYDGIVQLSEDSYSSDDFHKFVSDMKANWEEYNQKQCDNYYKVLQSIYGGGTAIRPIFAKYKYEMQKKWALQIVGIYEQLYIE